MSQARTVAVIIGSLRKDSVTRKVARAIEALAPTTLKFEDIPIGDLPLYNQEYDEAGPPASYVAFRDRIRAGRRSAVRHAGVQSRPPRRAEERHRRGSRPYGKSAWNGKPAAVVSVSPGAVGGFGANHQLRQSLVFLNMPTLQHEAYIGGRLQPVQRDRRAHQQGHGRVPDRLRPRPSPTGSRRTSRPDRDRRRSRVMRLPTYFIPHGAGPCFFMEWTRGPADTWDRTAAWLKGLIATLPERPKAVLVVSGHWEEAVFTLGSGEPAAADLRLLRLPEATYRLRFDAPGSPALARRARDLLGQAGFPHRRGPRARATTTASSCR